VKAVLSSRLLYRETTDPDQPQHFSSRAVRQTILGVVIRDNDQVVVEAGSMSQLHSATSTGAMPGLNLM
jgi:hypothetical protein